MMISEDTRATTTQRIRTSEIELERLARAGMLDAVLASDFGGAAGDGRRKTYLPLLDLLRTVGAADLAAGRIFEGHVNALALITQHASPSRRDVWLRDARRGRWFGVWNTDAATPVTLTRSGDTFTLRGAKMFCSGAGRVTRALITATLDDGRRQMLIVPMEDLTQDRIDQTSWRPLGMQSSDSFTIDFDGVTVSSDALFGEPNAYLEEPWFTGGSIRFAAVQLGGAERLAHEAAAYIRDRGRGADPFQKFRAGESAIALETGRLWLAGAAAKADRADLAQADADAFIAYARMTRSAIEASAQRVLRDVERSVGAFGFLEPLPFARLHRDLTMYLRQPAPDATIMAVGASILTGEDDAGSSP